MDLWERKVAQYCVNNNYISLKNLKQMVLDLKKAKGKKTLLTLFIEHFKWSEEEAQYIYENAKKLSYDELTEDIINLTKKNKNKLLTGRDNVQQIGRYQILGVIGKGGMGKVFLAYDPILEREIALKILAPGPNINHVQIERFIREAKATAKLKHPNIITIYDIGMDNDQRYITMEYIKGNTLAKAMKDERLSINELLSVLQKVIEAIDYAHNRNIVHRDLKPDNILLDENHEPYVMDFGIAKLLGASSKGNLTQEGFIIGSPYYMSPEQAQGANDELDNRTDIYSLGVILYEIITGRVPFYAPTSISIIMQIIKDEPRLPREIRPNIPKQLESICLKAIEKEQSMRYLTAKEFARILEDFLASKHEFGEQKHSSKKPEVDHQKPNIACEKTINDPNISALHQQKRKIMTEEDLEKIPRSGLPTRDESYSQFSNQMMKEQFNQALNQSTANKKGIADLSTENILKDQVSNLVSDQVIANQFNKAFDYMVKKNSEETLSYTNSDAPLFNEALGDKVSNLVSSQGMADQFNQAFDHIKKIPEEEKETDILNPQISEHMKKNPEEEKETDQIERKDLLKTVVDDLHSSDVQFEDTTSDQKAKYNFDSKSSDFTKGNEIDPIYGTPSDGIIYAPGKEDSIYGKINDTRRKERVTLNRTSRRKKSYSELYPKRSTEEVAFVTIDKIVPKTKKRKKKKSNSKKVFFIMLIFLLIATGLPLGYKKIISLYKQGKLSLTFKKVTLTGFKYLGEKKYTVGKVTNTVKEYSHNKTGIIFVLIPGGTFIMGNDQEPNESPAHKVSIQPFLMSKYEVTQSVWQKVMKNSFPYFEGKNKPIENISWKDCQKFCRRTGVKLPSEAQWEYACRGKTQTKYYWGNTVESKYMWYQDNSNYETHVVGTKDPNAFGLCDMLGNVWEWCQDNWYINYHNAPDNEEPREGSGKGRVNRGGSALNPAHLNRCASRSWLSDDIGYKDVGFRVCAEIEETTEGE